MMVLKFQTLKECGGSGWTRIEYDVDGGKRLKFLGATGSLNVLPSNLVGIYWTFYSTISLMITWTLEIRKKGARGLEVH